MEAHSRAAGLPTRSAAHVVAVEWNRETLEAAPGRANAEQRQRIDEGSHRRLWHWLQRDAEQAAGAGEIALPDRMPRAAFERRVKDAQHLRPLRKPARDLQ